MVDPDSCTCYDLNQYQLEEFLLFSVLVAGKTARFIAKALDGVLTDAHRRAQIELFRPFKAVKKG
jgi:hypothetical protein